jgi:hypothetical protein
MAVTFFVPVQLHKPFDKKIPGCIGSMSQSEFFYKENFGDKGTRSAGQRAVAAGP